MYMYFQTSCFVFLSSLIMTDSDSSMSSATNAQLTAMGHSEVAVKELSPLTDTVSSEISSSDSDPTTIDNTLTSLTPDPDCLMSQLENKPDSETQSDSITDTSLTGSSCTCSTKEMHTSPQKRRRVIADFQSPDWYKNKCFDRYWKHYKQAMSWCQRHFSIMKSMRQQHIMDNNPYMMHSPYYQQMCNYSNQSGRGRGVARGRGGVRGKATSTGRGRGQKPSPAVKVGKRKQKVSADISSSVCTEKDDDSGEESLEMEITDEMVKFFAHSEKHRKQRGIFLAVYEQDEYQFNMNSLKGPEKFGTHGLRFLPNFICVVGITKK